MSKRRCQLILGAHDSGKTRWLTRLFDARVEIYGKGKPEPLFLSALHPLSQWCESEAVASWHDAQSDHRKPWAKLSLHQKAEGLAKYLEQTQAILFIDDAHKLTGRKNQVARQCLQAARLWLMSSSTENRLAPNIRTLVERIDPQRTQLETEASYDSTQALLWCLAVLCLVGGAWEVSLVFAGLNALGRGRFGARAD